jgi:acetoin utilization protein AcuB
MRNESIDRVMTVSPATVAPGDLLAKARELFESSGIHHMPVVDNGQLVGILSASDFLKLHLLKNSNELMDKVTVRQLMQPNPVVLDSGANLRDAAEKFSVGEFHALPVVGDDGTVAGIVTTSDLLQYMLQHVPRGDGSIQEDASDLRSLAAENHLLKAVYDAAEHYIRSGHADHEHSVLVQSLDALRK